MMLLSKYIIKKSIANIFILLFIVVIIIFVFNIMNEINDLKAGSYTIFNMLFYITLLIPSYLYTILPIAILIGCNITAFSLVKSSEYVVIISSGLPKTFIIRNMFLLTFTMAIITFIIGNYVIPHSENFANLYKAQHISHNSSQHYLWIKENENRIVKIEDLEVSTNSNNEEIRLKNIDIFEYNNKDLLNYIHADYGIYMKNKFILKNANLYNYNTHNLQPQSAKILTIKTTITDKYLLNTNDSQEMSIDQLINFISYLKHSKQNSIKQEITLYSKLIYPIFCIIMGIVAILFVPYSSRHSSGAFSMALNIIIGFLIFFINKFAQYIAIYFGLPKTSSVIILVVSIIITSLIAIFKK